MKKQSRPVWMMPALVTGSVAALGALGTLAVKSAEYIVLPGKVEATEYKNAIQDKQIDRLITLQEYYQQQQQQAPNQAAPPAVREWKAPDTGQWWCCEERSGCEQDADWYRCE